LETTIPGLSIRVDSKDILSVGSADSDSMETMSYILIVGKSTRDATSAIRGTKEGNRNTTWTTIP